MNVFMDTGFEYGFNIIAPIHEDSRQTVIRGSSDTDTEPYWKLAQWFGKYDLRDATLTKGMNGAYGVHTQLHTVDALPAERELRLEMRANTHYAGDVRKAGEAWPHLLIEQSTDQNCPVFGKIQSLKLNFSAKLDYIRSYMDNPDNNLHAAQAILIMVIGDTLSTDYFWFGIPVFDNRYSFVPKYIALDSGKEDASGMPIYIMPQNTFVSRSLHSLEWVDYNVELIPVLKNVFKEIQSENYMKEVVFERLSIRSMNFGWEMTGEFDGAIRIRNLSLTALYDKD